MPVRLYPVSETSQRMQIMIEYQYGGASTGF